jgi:phosphoserine phosphatase RsbU/P
MMPKVDGYQVLIWIKDQARLRDLPVIMISALNDQRFPLHRARRRRLPAQAVQPGLVEGPPVAARSRRSGCGTRSTRILPAWKRSSMRREGCRWPWCRTPFQLQARSFRSTCGRAWSRRARGDLYDFFRTEDDKLCFLVGDVSGKGMSAALFMARAKSLIRVTADLMRSPNGGSASPADIVTRELCQDNSDMMFVTLFFAMFTPGTGVVEFCNAGHNSPYRLNGKTVELVEGAKGIILGIRADAVYTSGQLSLAPGEGIYVFTDGVTEANNPSEEMFGEPRLEAVLLACGGYRSAEIVKSVAEAVRGFVGAALPFDDITMLAVRRLEPAAL